jgi:hypothetical protein
VVHKELISQENYYKKPSNPRILLLICRLPLNFCTSNISAYLICTMKQPQTYPNSAFTILLITITLIVTLGALPINVKERDRFYFPVSVPRRNCHISQQPAKHLNTRSSNRGTRVHGQSLSFSEQRYQIYPPQRLVLHCKNQGHSPRYYLSLIVRVIRGREQVRGRKWYQVRLVWRLIAGRSGHPVVRTLKLLCGLAPWLQTSTTPVLLPGCSHDSMPTRAKEAEKRQQDEEAMAAATF